MSLRTMYEVDISPFHGGEWPLTVDDAESLADLLEIEEFVVVTPGDRGYLNSEDALRYNPAGPGIYFVRSQVHAGDVDEKIRTWATARWPDALLRVETYAHERSDGPAGNDIRLLRGGEWHNPLTRARELAADICLVLERAGLRDELPEAEEIVRLLATTELTLGTC